MSAYQNSANFDRQDDLDWSAIEAAHEAESRLYFATVVKGVITIPNSKDFRTSIDDARTELDLWAKECRDAGQSHLIPTLCVVRGLERPVVLFCGSARRVAS